GRGRTLYALSQNTGSGGPRGRPRCPAPAPGQGHRDGTFTAVTDHLDRPTSLEFIGTPPTLSPSAGRSGRSTTPPAPPAAPRAKRPPTRRRPLGLWIKDRKARS